MNTLKRSIEIIQSSTPKSPCKQSSVIYAGPLNTWLRNLKLISASFSIASTGLIGYAAPEMWSSGGILLTTTASLLPCLACYAFSKNYVTYLYQPAKYTKSEAGSWTQDTSFLTLERQGFFGKRILETVAVKDLIYKPNFLFQVWESRQGSKFFIEPQIMQTDPTLGVYWDSIREQSPPVASSLFHKDGPSTLKQNPIKQE